MDGKMMDDDNSGRPIKDLVKRIAHAILKVLQALLELAISTSPSDCFALLMLLLLPCLLISTAIPDSVKGFIAWAAEIFSAAMPDSIGGFIGFIGRAALVTGTFCLLAVVVAGVVFVVMAIHENRKG